MALGSVSAGVWGPIVGKSNLFDLSTMTNQGVYFWLAVLFLVIASMSFVAILFKRLLSLISLAFSGATLWVIAYYFHDKWPSSGLQKLSGITTSSARLGESGPLSTELGWGAFAILAGFILLLLTAPFVRKKNK